MMRYFLMLAVAVGLLCASPATAALKYYADPVHKKLKPTDPHPMDDMMDLAKDGNVRAQFIIGDLYSKGKGGFAKDLKEAHHWFEESAVHGYTHSFIRLAAIAKRQNNTAEAWQWYTLAINADDNDGEQKYAIQARQALTDGAKLTEDSIHQARESMKVWEDARDKQLQKEEADARAKERLQKDQAEKEAAEKKAAATVTTVAKQPDDPPTPTGEETDEQN